MTVAQAKKLTLRLLPGELAVWKLPPDAPIPPAQGQGFWSVTRICCGGPLVVAGFLDHDPRGDAFVGVSDEKCEETCITVLGRVESALSVRLGRVEVS